jgi:riboflavin synthase
MFTGIIEKTGRIEALRASKQGAEMSIAAEAIASTLKTGDSISVNGVCLTVVKSNNRMFECDISAETLRRTTFECAREGTAVNLERPLAVGSRLGGHFVLGDVDGVGKLLFSKPAGAGEEMVFGYPPELERYLVYKGSIAVDGISLTIAALQEASFSVSVIPHTLQNTNLMHLEVGDLVNLEVDILGKYFERFYQLGLPAEKGPKITVDYLKQQGY